VCANSNEISPVATLSPQQPKIHNRANHWHAKHTHTASHI